MTPFKKIKVLTQAELDAIELAGTQEEGIDYRVKGEINYYMHTVSVRLNDYTTFDIQLTSSDETEITTQALIYANKDKIVKTCFCSHSTYQDCMAVLTGVSSPSYDIGFFVMGSDGQGGTATDTISCTSSNISSITDTVVEL